MTHDSLSNPALNVDETAVQPGRDDLLECRSNHVVQPDSSAIGRKRSASVPAQFPSPRGAWRRDPITLTSGPMCCWYGVEACRWTSRSRVVVGRVVGRDSSSRPLGRGRKTVSQTNQPSPQVTPNRQLGPTAPVRTKTQLGVVQKRPEAANTRKYQIVAVSSSGVSANRQYHKPGQRVRVKKRKQEY
ncbi:unnamed protein product [Protopolystoma xenopodis]|uniref:Uncharacterized protein n=1 Tax=Protopolystoma xenopodis TaxID=117903 RepID=A0A3S5CQG3_9PLAT|nr:unnamed protein product [Protopolystoma xenopodis]